MSRHPYTPAQRDDRRRAFFAALMQNHSLVKVIDVQNVAPRCVTIVTGDGHASHALELLGNRMGDRTTIDSCQVSDCPNSPTVYRVKVRF